MNNLLKSYDLRQFWLLLVLSLLCGEAWRSVFKEDGGMGTSVTKKQEINAGQRLLLEQRININEATAQDLCALPGLGPVLAARIVERRRREGCFAKPEKLLRVRGVGPKTLAKIRPHIKVGRACSLTVSPGRAGALGHR